MDSVPEELVEVVYETDSSSSVSHELEPDERQLGFPLTVWRKGEQFRLVRREIVSRSGQRTRSRLVYRQT